MHQSPSTNDTATSSDEFAAASVTATDGESRSGPVDSSVPTFDLLRQLRDLETAERAAQAGKVLVLAELDRREAWRDIGAAGLGPYIADKLRVTYREANQYADLATHADRLPRTIDALASGRICLDQARTLANTAARTVPEPADTDDPFADADPPVDVFTRDEAKLVNNVRGARPGQARRVCNAWRTESLPASLDEELADQTANQGLRFINKRNGMIGIGGEFDSETASLLLNKLRPIETHLWKQDRTQHRITHNIPASKPFDPSTYDDFPTTANRSLRALVELLSHRPTLTVISDATAATSQPADPTTGAPARAVKHPVLPDQPVAPAETLPAGERPITDMVVILRENTHGQLVGEYADGTPIRPATVDRLSCNARIIRAVVDADDQPVNFGITRRDPSRAQRRAIAARDGGCTFPGCDRPPAWCDIHHITPVADRGPTDIINLTMLCSFHHHLVHEGGFKLRRRDDATIVVTTPDGDELTTSPNGFLNTPGQPEHLRRRRTDGPPPARAPAA